MYDETQKFKYDPTANMMAVGSRHGLTNHGGLRWLGNKPYGSTELANKYPNPLPGIPVFLFASIFVFCTPWILFYCSPRPYFWLRFLLIFLLLLLATQQVTVTL